MAKNGYDIFISYRREGGYFRIHMDNINRIPQPIDTSDVQLAEELNPLLEAMAKNVHEVWA